MYGATAEASSTSTTHGCDFSAGHALGEEDFDEPLVLPNLYDEERWVADETQPCPHHFTVTLPATQFCDLIDTSTPVQHWVWGVVVVWHTPSSAQSFTLEVPLPRVRGRGLSRGHHHGVAIAGGRGRWAVAVLPRG